MAANHSDIPPPPGTITFQPGCEPIRIQDQSGQYMVDAVLCNTEVDCAIVELKGRDAVIVSVMVHVVACLGCNDKEFPVNTPNGEMIGTISKKWKVVFGSFKTQMFSGYV
ncbi:hypothetical protein KIN20_012004 [Parelaphostrongylus tenuis]|uniref:Uncharacterized protein n=1 Tax=Parelaphostrongylus tenuis TaxID=148309 RepID=A0AAD5QK63_PARTN|nr:hypothetical protein KIN20_012004 [Parelaphostrongylus tenuis]